VSIGRRDRALDIFFEDEVSLPGIEKKYPLFWVESRFLDQDGQGRIVLKTKIDAEYNSSTLISYIEQYLKDIKRNRPYIAGGTDPNFSQVDAHHQRKLKKLARRIKKQNDRDAQQDKDQVRLDRGNKAVNEKISEFGKKKAGNIRPNKNRSKRHRMRMSTRRHSS
jgi:hypothetical protein